MYTGLGRPGDTFVVAGNREILVKYKTMKFDGYLKVQPFPTWINLGPIPVFLN